MNDTLPTGWRALPWRALLPTGAGVLAVSIGGYVRVPLLPDMGADLGMGAAQLGLVTTSFALGRLLTDLPVGRLVERASPATALGAAGLALGVGGALLAVAPVAWAAIGAAAVLGVASATANTTGMVQFSTSTGRAQRGLAMAAFSSSLLVGQALGPLLGGAVADGFGWRAAAWSAALLGVAVTVPSWLPGMHRRRAQRRGRSHGGGDGLRSASATAQSAAPAAAAGVAPTPPLSERMAVQSVGFAMFFSLGAMPQTLVPLVGAGRLGLGAGAIGLALGLGGVCRFVGGLLGGVIADRLARRAALLPGLALQAVGVLLLAGGSRAWWLASIVVMSLASWSISVAGTIIADRAGPGRVGGAMGTFRFVGDVGLVAGPTVAALVYDRVGTLAAATTVAAVLTASALACALLVPESRWGPPGSQRDSGTPPAHSDATGG